MEPNLDPSNDSGKDQAKVRSQHIDQLIAEAQPTLDSTQDTMWCAVKWLQTGGKNNNIPDHQMRDYTAAVKAFVGADQKYETIKAPWILQRDGEEYPNLKALRHQYNQSKGGANVATANKYERNCRKLADKYVRFCVSPDTFRYHEEFAPATNGNGKKDKDSKTERKPGRSKATSPEPEPAIQTNSISIPIPLAAGKVAKLQLPEGLDPHTLAPEQMVRILSVILVSCGVPLNEAHIAQLTMQLGVLKSAE